MTLRNHLNAPLACAAFSLAIASSVNAQSLPVCNNNGPYLQECNGQLSSVPVTSAGSFDPDGTPITVLWFEECSWAYFDDPTNPAPNFVLDMGLNCTRNCVFALRVFSGGQMKNCVSNATVQDSTAPALSTVPDITDLWGIPTGVVATGSPIASDACDPAPLVQLIGDVHTGSTGPGHEDTIVRTWLATDNCGHSAQTSQRITLLSPLGGGSNLEVDINQCDDVFDRGNSSINFDVTLLGRTGTLVTGIKLNSIKLSRLGDQSNFVYPINPAQFAPADVAILAAQRVGDCNPPGTDGKKDLKLRFDRAQVRAALGLDTLPVDSVVYVAIRGLRNNNTPFIAGAKMRVH
jgi:hypothetical protein